MPARGVKQGTKRARQYEHIKEKARAEESRTSSRTSTNDMRAVEAKK